MLADFVLQTGWIASRKQARNPGALALHGAVVLACAGADDWATRGLAAGGCWRLCIWRSTSRRASRRRGWPAFLGDQAAHLASLVGAGGLAAGALGRRDLGRARLAARRDGAAAGALIATRAGGFAVGLLMERHAATDLPAGLPDGGRVIGLLERGLIFILVLVGQPAGIGFLIAAKSVLRFDTASKDTRAGEYVIIGTLASFGWALVAAYATTALIDALPPIGFPTAHPRFGAKETHDVRHSRQAGRQPDPPRDRRDRAPDGQKDGHQGLRLGVKKGGCAGMEYTLDYADRGQSAWTRWSNRTAPG